MEKSESIVKLAGALCEAQKTELFALTSSKNPFFKSKYADLSSVWDAIRKPLTDNGLAITQTFNSSNVDGVTIETTLMHSSGEYISGSLYIKPEKNTPQGLGSATTYGRRYALMAIIGISPEDDDGERAMARKGMDRKVNKKTTIPEPDVPKTVIKKPDTNKVVETWDAFIARKKLKQSEMEAFEGYIVESAKSLGMNSETLKNNAVDSGDLDDMLDAAMAKAKDDKANEPNWWDSTKHWSFRSEDDLKSLVLFGFGKNKESGIKVCDDNPGSADVLKLALPETKKALVKKYDKMFGVGEFSKLISK